MKNSVNSCVKYFKRHTVFRKAGESLCTDDDDDAETDKTYVTLPTSIACCLVSLLNLSQMDAIARIHNLRTSLDFSIQQRKKLLQRLLRLLLWKKDQIIN
jgi:hypothetical protein